MPNIKSAAKRVRTSAREHASNKGEKGLIATLRKNLFDAIASGDKVKSMALFQQFASRLDKAVKHGAIKANAADRRKGRAAIRLNKLGAA